MSSGPKMRSANEAWKEFPLDTNYMVSSLGRIFSKGRWIGCGPPPGRRWVDGKILSPWVLRGTGYCQVWLTGRKKWLVHRMVAITFFGSPRARVVVNHKNGVRDDNRVDNLEWVTNSENLKHGYRELGSRPSSLGRFGGRHQTSKPVIKVDPISGKETRYESAIDAVREHGFDSGSISRCCNNPGRKHKGFEWRFAGTAE